MALNLGQTYFSYAFKAAYLIPCYNESRLPAAHEALSDSVEIAENLRVTRLTCPTFTRKSLTRFNAS